MAGHWSCGTIGMRLCLLILSLSSFFRYMIATVVTWTTSPGHSAAWFSPTRPISTYQFKFRVWETWSVPPQHPVGISGYSILTRAGWRRSGWNLFVAAMTPSNELRSDRITKVHNRASLFGNQSLGIFPVMYGSTDGSDVSGMARWDTSEFQSGKSTKGHRVSH